MINNFYKTICTVCVVGAFCACSDWDDHYENTSVDEGGSMTLWEQMKNTAELSDFCDVLEQTKVYRLHRKTPVSYAELLQGGQSFTVIAPVNGSFDKDSLIKLTQTVEGDSIVERFFVQNQLSPSLTSIKDDAARMHMLNKKGMNIASGMIEGVTMNQVNKSFKNGLLHVSSKPLPYHYTIFEQLCADTSLAVVGNAIRFYDKEKFDEESSVLDSVNADGEMVYVDSVFYQSNSLLSRIGLLKAEDSTYLVAVPTTEAWKKAWDEATSYFVYPKSEEKRDSLQQLFTTRALLEDAIFSRTTQTSPEDSVKSRLYDRLHPEYHVFHKPYEEGGIFYGAEEIKCSNGTIYKTKEWSFTPENTYFKLLRTEAEDTWLIKQPVTQSEINLANCAYYVRQTSSNDSIKASEGEYLHIKSAVSDNNWQITFNLKNTLSGTYDIYVVCLPHSVYEKKNPSPLPCRFKASINYLDVNGKFVGFKTLKGSKPAFETSGTNVDSVLIAKDFTFPVCDYNDNSNAQNVLLKLERSVTAAQETKYNRELFLDCIILKPKRK